MVRKYNKKVHYQKSHFNIYSQRKKNNYKNLKQKNLKKLEMNRKQKFSSTEEKFLTDRYFSTINMRKGKSWFDDLFNMFSKI